MKLEVFDSLGQKVVSLVDREQKAGYKTARCDANLFSSGTYSCRLTVIRQELREVRTKKMILLGKRVRTF